MISCAQAVRELWDYLENDLAPTDREQVEEHLAFCRRCCGELEFAEELRAFLASSSSNDLPVDVEARIESFLAALEEKGQESV